MFLGELSVFRPLQGSGAHLQKGQVTAILWEGLDIRDVAVPAHTFLIEDAY